MTNPDVIVVGAGVVGASCAYFLTEAGFKVTLIDRTGIAAGTSSRCQSTVGAGVGTLSAHAYFKAAVATYTQLLEQGFSLGYQKTPSLVVATDDVEAGQLITIVEELRHQDGECEVLDPAQARELEPHLAGDLTAVALDRGNAQVNPMFVALELVQACARKGAQVMPDAAVLDIDVREGRFHSVQTSRGSYSARHLVLAAGVWSREIGRLAGLSLPVWPRKGHIVVSEPLRGWLRHCIVELAYESSLGAGFGHAVNDSAPVSPPEVGTIVQPLPTGQLLIGSSRELSGLDTDVSRQRLREILVRAGRLLPGITDIRAMRCYAGLRPWTPDGRPLIGACQGIDGVVLATGHGGGGITGGPLTGRIIADQLAGTQPIVDADAYRPDRYGDQLYATAGVEQT